MFKSQNFTKLNRAKPSASEPVDYIENEINRDLCPTIISPPLKYAPEGRSSLFADCQLELGALKTQVLRYQANNGLPSQDIGTLSKKTANWDEVQQMITAVIRQEGSDDESNKAKMSCAKISKNLPAFETWLYLLPDGDYGAFVSGVFKMIIGAAKRVNEVRLAIFESLATIPESVARAKQYICLYSDSRPQELQRKTAQPCHTILAALRHIVEYFNQRNWEGALKAFVQGSTYRKTLQSALEQVQKLASEIDQEANVLSHHRIGNIERAVKRIEIDVRRLQAQPFSVQADEVFKQELMHSIGGYVVNSIFSQLSSHRIMSTGYDIQGACSSYDFGSHKNLQCRGSMSQHQIDKKRLSKAVALPDHNPTNDLQQCLQKGKVLSLKDQDRAKWMMSSPKVRMWLNHLQSKSLLINGNDEGNELFSATTFLSARLAQSLAQIQPIIILKFFCGLHTTAEHPEDRGATGLLRSVIMQLLERDIAWDLNWMRGKDLDKLKGNEIAGLLDLCRTLLQQLPPMTLLYWMIDGITFYEREEYRRDFETAINELLGIIDDCEKIVIKLLLTCHGRSFSIDKYIQDEDILLVPSVIDGENQGLSDYAWDRRTGDDLRTIEQSAVDRDAWSWN